MQTLVTRLLFLTLFVISSIFVGQSFARIDPETAVGMWLFDEATGKVAADSSGNGNKGKIIGAELVDGKFGKALYFDGNDNCVEVQDADSLNPEEQISIVMWVYPDPGQNCDGGNNWRFLIGKGGWGSYHLIWESDWGNNEIGWTLSIAGTDKRLWTNTGAPPEQWTHLGFTYHFKDGSTVHINGEQQAGQSAAGPVNGPIATNPGVLKIGGGSNKGCPAGSGYFGGIIDEVAIFNATLAPEDIENIMNKGLEKAVGSTAVSSHGKLANTWASIKEN
jgi:hypothetical protein